MMRSLITALVLACAVPAWAGPAPWPDAPYSYYANNAKLETVLADFASGFSLSLSVPPELGGAVVSGRFNAKNPTEFITKLGGVYGFVWYTYAGTLFVSRASDVTTRGVSAPGGNISNMRKALTELGVLEPRFGWGELPEQGVALVSGPASYVTLVEATVRNLPARAQQMQVFRLKHAAADDRTVMYRDKEITTPGLATILRELITGRGRSGSRTDALTAMAAPLRNTPPVSGDATGALASSTTGPSATSQTGAPGSVETSVRGISPSIQSDPRLNAIIVQDLPERMPIYRQLIEQLDAPTSLVEIEAMIIDVNTERARELGINWAGRDGRNAGGFGVLTDPQSGTLTLARGPDNTISPSTLVVASGNYLISQIRLLETNGDANIQSRPSVLTSENLGALLDLSETFYIRTTGERVATVTPVTAGTTLRVTPRVVYDGTRQMVQLVIDIEDGQIEDRRIDTLPTVRRSTVSTQAIVSQGEALLIAGYTQDQSVLSDQRVPVVGEIPVVGLLFSNKTRTVQKRERMFMIRPKVVSLPGQAPVAGDAQKPS